LLFAQSTKKSGIRSSSPASITVHVEEFAERGPVRPQQAKVTDANLTSVAIDRDGRPRPIPAAGG